MDSLAEEITPMARGIHMASYNANQVMLATLFVATVPDSVKKELLQHIRDYLEQKQ